MNVPFLRSVTSLCRFIRRTGTLFSLLLVTRVLASNVLSESKLLGWFHYAKCRKFDSTSLTLQNINTSLFGRIPRFSLRVTLKQQFLLLFWHVTALSTWLNFSVQFSKYLAHLLSLRKSNPKIPSTLIKLSDNYSMFKQHSLYRELYLAYWVACQTKHQLSCT